MFATIEVLVFACVLRLVFLGNPKPLRGRTWPESFRFVALYVFLKKVGRIDFSRTLPTLQNIDRREWALKLLISNGARSCEFVEESQNLDILFYGCFFFWCSFALPLEGLISIAAPVGDQARRTMNTRPRASLNLNSSPLFRASVAHHHPVPGHRKRASIAQHLTRATKIESSPNTLQSETHVLYRWEIRRHICDILALSV